MTTTVPKSPDKRPRASRKVQEQWIAQFRASGLSARAFAQKHQLNYTTLKRWMRKNQSPPKAPPFVEVSCDSPATTRELHIETPSGLRLTVTAAEQINWVRALIAPPKGNGSC